MGVEGEGSVRVWRADVAGGCVCISGATTGYSVDPVGEYVVGVMVAGAMRVRRGRERLVFGPRDVCTWDPSAAHCGTPYGCTHWEACLLILESPALERILRGPEPLATDLCFSRPLVRDPRLAQRFVELHRTLETPSWALEREALLADWLRDVSDGAQSLDDRRRAARRDPALRRACELLHEELAGNVTLDELARAEGVHVPGGGLGGVADHDVRGDVHRRDRRSTERVGLVRLSGQTGVAGRCDPERPAEVPMQVALVEEPGRLRHLGDGNPALEHPPRVSDAVGELEAVRRHAVRRAKQP